MAEVAWSGFGKDEAMRLRSLQSSCAEAVLWENRGRLHCRCCNTMLLDQKEASFVHGLGKSGPEASCTRTAGSGMLYRSIAELVIYPLLSPQQAMSQELRL